jgi:hypothetical protein
LAAEELVQQMKVLPLVVLGIVVILGILLYWVSTKTKITTDSSSSREPKPEEKPPQTVPKTHSESKKEAVDVQEPPKDPGAKILEGADRAFKTGYFETALVFYKDFELRYAGSDTYDQNSIRVFERIHTASASSEKRDPDLPKYLDTRRRLHEEWKRLKALVTSQSATAAKAELEKFLGSLPPKDGRRPIVEGWLAPAKDEK